MESLLYQGKSKKIFLTDRPDEVIQEFTDSITAGNNAKKDSLSRKGETNCRISTLIFEYLSKRGVPTHFIETVTPTRMRVRRLSILPVEVIVRNRVAGSTAKRLGLEEGRELPEPLVTFHLKSDNLNDPLVTEDELILLSFLSRDQIEATRTLSLQINRSLSDLFRKAGIELVDFKVEFGKDASGRILLADEITPDSCRLWDLTTKEKLDKDRFRRDLGGVMKSYLEVLQRLERSL